MGLKRLLKKLSDSPVSRRMIGGFGANLLGKIWVMLTQLISVPILTAAWGLDGFGLWLIINTIPAYLAISDFGLATAAGVEITRAVARDDRPAALRAFQTIWLFITAVICLVAIGVVIGLAIWICMAPPIDSDSVGRKEIAGAAVCVTLGAIFGVQMSVLKLIYQATHKYALGTILFDICMPLSSIGVILVALNGGGLVAAAATNAAISAVMLVIYSQSLKRFEPWCSIGIEHASRADLRRLLKPSFAAFALTASNSLGIQGVVLAIGWTMGPAVAALYATARMLSRTPLQFAGLLTRASLPELTRSIDSDDNVLTRRLMRANIASTLAVMLPSLIILIVWGPKFLEILSHGKMSAGHLFFAVLALSALFNALWTTLGTKLVAANRQAEYAWLVLGLYTFVAVMPFLVGGEIMLLLIAMVAADFAIFARVWVRRARNDQE